MGKKSIMVDFTAFFNRLVIIKKQQIKFYLMLFVVNPKNDNRTPIFGRRVLNFKATNSTDARNYVGALVAVHILNIFRDNV